MENPGLKLLILGSTLCFQKGKLNFMHRANPKISKAWWSVHTVMHVLKKGSSYGVSFVLTCSVIWLNVIHSKLNLRQCGQTPSPLISLCILQGGRRGLLLTSWPLGGLNFTNLCVFGHILSSPLSLGHWKVWGRVGIFDSILFDMTELACRGASAHCIAMDTSLLDLNLLVLLNNF